jgi:hypothetical protein
MSSRGCGVTIWKFNLATTDKQTIQMPKGARILCLQMQNAKATMWAIVDDTKPLTNRVFVTVGTGRPIADTFLESSYYVGTYQDGWFVWHVFEQTGRRPIGAAIPDSGGA